MNQPICLLCHQECPEFTPFISAELNQTEQLSLEGWSSSIEMLGVFVRRRIAICYRCFRDEVPQYSQPVNSNA